MRRAKGINSHAKLLIHLGGRWTRKSYPPTSISSNLTAPKVLSTQTGGRPKILSPHYPPLGHWVADTKDIETKWVQHLATYHLSDKKHKRYPTMLLDPSKFESREVVGMVIRNYGNHKEFLDWASSTLKKKSTEIAHSVRVSLM